MKSITLVGAGSLAQALGPALRKAGYRIDALVARERAESRRRAAALARRLGAKVVGLAEFRPEADVVWLCHTDDALGQTARRLARRSGWRGRIVLHSSGALSSRVLAALQRAGAHTASLHPMMTFVPGTSPTMSHVPFAVEGDRAAVAAARNIVRKLGSKSFEISPRAKVLYHALGSFSSPMVVAALVTAERVGRAAGLKASQVRDVMIPILQQTISNYIQRGPAAAFSGPIKRGDLKTVQSHLRELRRVPEARDVYRALVRSALRELPTGKRSELLRLVK